MLAVEEVLGPFRRRGANFRLVAFALLLTVDVVVVGTFYTRGIVSHHSIVLSLLGSIPDVRGPALMRQDLRQRHRAELT